MLTRLKKKVQSLLVSQAYLIHRAGLSPNHLSFIGLIFAALSGIYYSQANSSNFFMIGAPILLVISGYFDALDGVLAREYDQITKLGGFLDSLFDRYTDVFIFLGIIVGDLCHPFWGIVALTGSLLVSYTRARSEAGGIRMETVGLTERAERILIIVIASLLNLFVAYALGWGIVLLAVLTNITVLQRAYHFYKRSKDI